MECLRNPFLFPLPPQQNPISQPPTTIKRRRRLLELTPPVQSSISSDPWSLSDGNSRKIRTLPYRRHPRKPLSDDDARRIIHAKAQYLIGLRRNQGSGAQTPRWIRRTPEQMAQLIEDDRDGNLHGKHVVAAIRKVRALAQLPDGSYNMREVMGSFVTKLSFKEMCTVLKEQRGWRQARDFFAWMKLQSAINRRNLWRSKRDILPIKNWPKDICKKAQANAKAITTLQDMARLSEILKSKHEEGRTYLSEIECIGQSYEDMQTQNQHLLQQIIERDDYNIKLVMEGMKEKQMQEALRLEIQTMNRKLQEAKLLMDSYDLKVSKMDEQLKMWSEQVGKLAEDARQGGATFEHTKKRLLEVQMEAQKLRQLLDGVQDKVEGSRLEVANLLIELEKERYNKKRTEESLEVMTRKAASLRAQTKGSVLEKLRQEVKEYRGILKCSICLDRQKEVVIAKCYHLFCHQCVQRTLSIRQRKCPTCGASFSPNDVKPIYI
ncbi:E3 ubiquitin-protein ligase BRE1-like 1 [Curcuma longa]|uniref:E3 ubiquitin-protein ligase BRE1-like 1 n=1 Tax=Curcuma longa TaxID=136217 RepID=UPI003D9F8304